MTSVHDPRQPASGTYPWQGAPPHLKTRRQLRALGLRPNGQDHAGLMVRETKSRRARRLWAYLFDVDKAAPKRTATPAQLEAVEKAVRERRARAAERHGVPREELDQVFDPGPAWRTDHTTHHEEASMSDTTETPMLGAPTGHGQRIAYLHAIVAVNQARNHVTADRLRAEQRARGGDEDIDRAEDEWAQAQSRLRADTPWQDRNAVVSVLTDALTWRQTSELAAERSDQITAAYAQEWGVLIDAETGHVGIDPQFDSTPIQDFNEAAAVWARETAVSDAVAAAPLPEHTKTAVDEALTASFGAGVDPADPRTYIGDQAQRREHLRTALATVQMPESDRKLVGFTVAYLCGDTADVDLLETPVLVDPSEEARGRVPELLDRFAHGRITPAAMAEEISVMTDTDQQAVRDAGRAIVAGQAADQRPWPGYVDRDALREELRLYATDADDQRQEADYIVDTDTSNESPEMIGVRDEIGERIPRMAARRHQLHEAATHGVGLTSCERHQISATIEDIDVGRIRGDEQLPELLFVDERTKAAADHDRSRRPASALSAATRHAAGQLIENINVEPASREARLLDLSVSSINDTLYSVADGAGDGVDAKRQRFLDGRADLGKALTAAGADPDTKTAVRELIDSQAHEAGQLGRIADQRRTQWHTRNDQITTQRDDALAQRAAVNAGRPTSTPDRTRTPRPAQAIQHPSPTPGRSASLRSLHTHEVGQ